MARLLDTQFVDTDGRWLVLHPTFIEVLKDEDSRLLNADFGESGGLRAGLQVGRIHGFDVYMSNNLPKRGTGPELQVQRTKTQTLVLSLQDTVQQ